MAKTKIFLAAAASLAAATLVSCNEAPRTNDVAQSPSPSTTAKSDAIRCLVYYDHRSSKDGDDRTERFRMEPGDTRNARFRDMRARLSFTQDSSNLKDLHVFTYGSGGDGRRITSHLYPFDEEGISNQAGLGFTGLVYVFHPTTSAQIQYECRVAEGA